MGKTLRTEEPRETNKAAFGILKRIRYEENEKGRTIGPAREGRGKTSRERSRGGGHAIGSTKDRSNGG